MDYISQLQKPQNTPQDIAAENARFMSRVYMWMAIGVLLSAVTSMYVASNEQLVRLILMNKIVFYGLLIAEVLCVISFSAFVQKISAPAATGLYLFYCFLTGLTLSVIFFVYTRESIVQVFGITSFAFAGLSAFGFITKRDLGPVGSFCMMGLWGMIGFGLLSLFFPSMMTSTASKVYGIVGVIVFAGLTAYDTQKIKATNIIGNEGTAEDHKEAIHGALILYLDFINLFLSLLRLMGKKK
ncbi:Bax inhibitor-1/YccA family protein [bacterium]|nr:Bax inhibitor-1/YccA family protein [bacterium]